jgi:hypothetical protein
MGRDIHFRRNSDQSRTGKLRAIEIAERVAFMQRPIDRVHRRTSARNANRARPLVGMEQHRRHLHRKSNHRLAGHGNPDPMAIGPSCAELIWQTDIRDMADQHHGRHFRHPVDQAPCDNGVFHHSKNNAFNLFFGQRFIAEQFERPSNPLV